VAKLTLRLAFLMIRISLDYSSMAVVTHLITKTIRNVRMLL